MIYVLAAAAAIFVVFFLMPALFFVLYCSGHRESKDFDQDPGSMCNTPYEAWEDIILQKVRRLRRIPCQSVQLSADDGTPLYARWYPRGGKTAVLLHGYRSTPFNNFFAIAEAFQEAGWSVLMPDMRGNGKSGGRSTLGLKEADDALAWAGWAAMQPGCTDIVMYGMSMGGAAITFASSGDWPDKVRVLVVDAGYHNVLQKIYGLKQLRFVPKHVFVPLASAFFRCLLHVRVATSGLDALKQAVRPMCFIAGSEDTTVDSNIVEESYRACGAEKVFFKIDGAPHTLAFLAGGNELKASLFEFIQQYTNQ